MSPISVGYIQGLDELNRKLKELAPKVEKKVLRSVWRKTSNTLRDAARAKAPVKQGILKKNIKVLSSRAKQGNIKFKVWASATKVSKKFPTGFPYALAVEAGHEFPGRGKNTHKKRVTPHQAEFGKSFVRPHPFMRPAWESTKDKLLDTFASEAGQGIEKVAQEKS